MSETAKNTYADMLAGIKTRVQTARVRAGLAANRELIQMYWDSHGGIRSNQVADSRLHLIERLDLLALWTEGDRQFSPSGY